MGRKNKSRYHKSLHQLVHERLQSMQAFGQSKRAAVTAGEDKGKIFSFATYQTYKKHIGYYLRWLHREHPEVTTLKAARRYAREWLELRADQRDDKGRYLSSWTIQTEAAALNKLFQIDRADPDRFIPPVRRREDIMRSRMTTARDTHFSVTNNAELINFCCGTGCRRNALEKLEGRDLWTREQMEKELSVAEKRSPSDQNMANKKALVDALNTFPEETVFIHHRSDKGGRSRYAPIVGPYKEQIIARMRDRKPHEKVWEHVHSAADVHGYRAEYAAQVYRKYARKYDDIPYDRVYPGSGIRYKSEVYYCRKDERGRRLDKKAMQKASKALGHNRLCVIADHYLRGL